MQNAMFPSPQNSSLGKSVINLCRLSGPSFLCSVKCHGSPRNLKVMIENFFFFNERRRKKNDFTFTKKKKGKIKKMINVGTLYLCITLHHASSLIMENWWLYFAMLRILCLFSHFIYILQLEQIQDWLNLKYWALADSNGIPNDPWADSSFPSQKLPPLP